MFKSECRADYGFLTEQTAEPKIAEVLARKQDSLPVFVHAHPDETVAAAIGILREYNVSQLPVMKQEPPVMVAEVVGSVVERDLLDALVSGRANPKDPVGEHMSAPLPMVGSGEQVSNAGHPRAGYEYSRTANPTRTALEQCLAALEGGARALAFASGMAAEDCLLRTICRPGDHVLIPQDAYGGTYRLFDRVLAPWQVSYEAVPVSDPQAVKHALEQRPVRAVWVETPTNPLLSIVDITALAVLCAEAGALLVVDNTFASPYLQNPLALGADVVVHSTTKYLGGHSDVVGGALVVADPELGERLAFMPQAPGAVAGPFDAC